MYTTNPITTEDGRVFDRLSINLAITTKVLPDGQTDVSCSARMVPTTADGTHTLDDFQFIRSFNLGSLAVADQDTMQAVAVISEAVQQWITTKGL